MTTLAAARRTVPSIHFSRPQRHDRPADADPVGEAGRGRCARTATSALPTPSIRHSGRGGGGLAWGSCGRSGRHALGRAAGASCVQRLDDSRNSAIHTTYRISLRSSSLQEPRYPLLRVVAMVFDPPGGRHLSPASVVSVCAFPPRPARGRGGTEGFVKAAPCLAARRRGDTLAACDGRGVPLSTPRRAACGWPRPDASPAVSRLGHGGEAGRPRLRARPLAERQRFAVFVRMCVNDPSAGSPTETLLRLLLPLNDKVQWTSRDVAGSEPPTSPRSEHFTGPFNR